MEERTFVCKFCFKKFPSGKALGGHIRIHTNENSVRYKGSKKKRLVKQREMVAVKQQRQEQQFRCRECGQGFVSLKALSAHMASHSEGEKKTLMDSQSDSETSSSPTKKRSKRAMRQSNSESFSSGSSSFDSETTQDVTKAARTLMKISSDTDSSFKKGRNLVINSLGESSENNSVIVETKSSSGEELKICNVKNQVLETGKVADDDQLGSADDDGVILCDSKSSDSDYFMNGPKKSESDISVDGSFKNTGFGSGFNNSLNRFRSSDEGGAKYELSKRRKVLPSYDTDSCADTNSKIHRFRDSKPPSVRKAGGEIKKSKSHECPICFRVFKSGQALGGHKRSHSFANQFDLNLPASDIDE